MIKYLLICACALAGIGGVAMAQAPNEIQQKSLNTQRLIWQVNLLSEIMPIAMKKDQYNAILLALEKARQKERETLKVEDDTLAKLDVEVQKAYDDAIDHGVYPPRDLIEKIVKTNRALSIQRQLMRGTIEDDVYAVVDKTLDIGQKKVMANSLNPKDIDPSAKPDQMTDEQKEKFFIRVVFLDDLAYDLMVKLAAKAS